MRRDVKILVLEDDYEDWGRYYMETPRAAIEKLSSDSAFECFLSDETGSDEAILHAVAIGVPTFIQTGAYWIPKKSFEDLGVQGVFPKMVRGVEKTLEPIFAELSRRGII